MNYMMRCSKLDIVRYLMLNEINKIILVINQLNAQILVL
jgi:hypothetical protein